MELWIRSQDKQYLIQVDYLCTGGTYDNEVITNKNDISYSLGTYRTKERASEVLDEIQSLLMPKLILNSYDNITPEFSQNLTIMPISTDVKQFNSYVYQMPKE